MKETSTVPCNGCTICCHHEQIMVHQEYGDNPADYRTVAAINPINNMPCEVLERQANGACIYLGESGCTIYEKRPHICRHYDCRKFTMILTNAEKRSMIEANPLNREEFDQGKKLAPSLTHDERQQCIKTRNERIKYANRPK